MLSSQEEQEERRRVFAQDQSLRNQGSTLHAHAVADAETPRGRYTAHERSTVIGSTGLPNYPAGPAWSADPGSQYVEPPLSFDNPALELGLATEAQATGPTSADAPSLTPLSDAPRAGVGSLSHKGDLATEETAFPPQPGMVPKFRSPTPRRL